MLDRHDTTVIEDSALADLAFAGRVRPELTDLCRRAVVISVGSFSKVAWGGLRLGGSVPRRPSSTAPRTFGWRPTSVPRFPQLLALQLLPHLEDVAARRVADLGENLSRAVDVITVDFPDWSVARKASRMLSPHGGSPPPQTGWRNRLRPATIHIREC